MEKRIDCNSSMRPGVKILASCPDFAKIVYDRFNV